MLLALGQRELKVAREDDPPSSPLVPGARDHNAVLFNSVSGDNDPEDHQATPRQFQISVHRVPFRLSISSMSTGATHCLAVTVDGKLYAWGLDGSGELGHGPGRQTKTSPTLVREFLRRQSPSNSWAGATQHQGGLTNSHDHDQSNIAPALVTWPCSRIRVATCAAGACHSAIITTDGVVLACGSGTAVGLGEPSKIHSRFSEITFPSETTMIGIAAGHHHTVGRTHNSNEVWVWGSGKDGRLGTGRNNDEFVPCRIMIGKQSAEEVEPSAPNGEKRFGSDVMDVCCGYSHTIALTRSGLVYTWGNGRQGCLGHGNFLIKNVPQVVNFVAPESRQRSPSPKHRARRARQQRKAVRIAAGAFMSLVLLTRKSSVEDHPSASKKQCCSDSCDCEVVYFGKCVPGYDERDGYFAATPWPMVCQPSPLKLPRGLHVDAMGCDVSHVLFAVRHCRHVYLDKLQSFGEQRNPPENRGLMAQKPQSPSSLVAPSIFLAAGQFQGVEQTLEQSYVPMYQAQPSIKQQYWTWVRC